MKWTHLSLKTRRINRFHAVFLKIFEKIMYVCYTNITVSGDVFYLQIYDSNL